MTKLLFSYRKKENPQNTGNFYTPSFDFNAMYPEMKGVATMTDELLDFSKYKTLPNWTKSWVNIWTLEVDETLLASFWKDIAYIEWELLIVGSVYAMKIETPQSLADFIRTYTDYEEVSPNVFKLADAYVDMMTNLDVAEKLLDLN